MLNKWILVAAVALGACSSRPELTEIPLPTLAGPDAPALSTCPTAKCLTVVVVPWSGVCRALVPNILALRQYLTDKGVTTRIVVGQSTEDKLKPFAGSFGPDTQLDPSGTVPDKGGVPSFVITDAEGRLLKRINGLPSGAPTPESLAATLDLP